MFLTLVVWFAANFVLLDRDGFMLIVGAAMWGAPALLAYVLLMRSWAGSFLAAAALAFLGLVVQAYVASRWPFSSTAPVGFLYLLLFGLPLIFVMKILEVAFTDQHQDPDRS